MANGIEIARLYHSHIYVREITTAEDTILEMWWFLKGGWLNSKSEISLSAQGLRDT